MGWAMADSTFPGHTPVFVIRDLSVASVDVVLDAWRRELDGAVVPGLDRQAQGHVHDDVVLPGIEAAQQVVALVDKPNVNVGFEIGYALGRRKRVKLVAVRADVPDWLGGSALAGCLVRTGATDVEHFRAILAHRSFLVAPRGSVRGPRSVIVCPRNGEGSGVRSALTKAGMDAVVLDGAGRSDGRGSAGDLAARLSAFSEQLAGVDQVAWVVTAPLPGVDRDGSENAACAILAGYARGQGRRVEILLKTPFPRTLADLDHAAVSWSTLDDVITLLKERVGPPEVRRPQPTPTGRSWRPEDGWDYRTLSEQARRWQGHYGYTGSHVVECLWSARAGATLGQLGALHRLFDELGHPWSLAFFDVLGDRTPPDVERVVVSPAGALPVARTDPMPGLALGKYPVTESEWSHLEGSRSRHRLPKVGISWWCAYLFARWVGGHLPTVEQWSRAAGRGDWPSAPHSEYELCRSGWFADNTDELRPVGQRAPGPFELRDLLGGVYEWCHDRHGLGHVVVGASFLVPSSQARERWRDVRDEPGGDVGFRVAWSTEVPS